MRRVAARVVNPGGAPSATKLRAAVAGQTILVTGASHGIGRHTAIRLGRAGATVLLVARSVDVLEELAEQLRADGGKAFAYAADLSDAEEAVPALAARILAEHGPPDVVVNNAGKSIRRAIDRSYDRFHDFTRTADLNYLGPVRLLLALLPAMRERGSGHVVNVSTVGVLLPPTPRWSAYQASKAAFDTWLRAAAAEMHADGVTATSLYMALVHTRMSAPTDDFKLVPGLSPDEAAGLVCHAIVDRPSAITPWWVTTAALIDVAARGTSDRLVRLYATRFTSRTGAPAAGPSNGASPADSAPTGDPRDSA
ncbi:MAG TPA: SDR family NAD(P)-dependent oxidoreductase [Conexibacter sp.]|nr:SDR family NAD(P)-dependent oxidoreductase [Conexibacter sp.]